MSNSGQVVLTENKSDRLNLLNPAVLDGSNKIKLFENRVNGNEEIGMKPLPSNTVNNIFVNAYSVMKYFADPTCLNVTDQNLSKVLCIGKVQSGKTAFFISTIAIAFDNGYNLACLIGGTKNPLREQNLDRVQAEFSNNDNIVVLNFNYADTDEIKKYLNSGKKVVLVVLKNAAANKNLGALKKIIEDNIDQPTLIIDDEGDEYSPGAPQSKSKENRTHSVLSKIIYTPCICTYLSVTATPQANLLISTPDPLSPDYCVLVQPGEGYVGGIDFHDSLNNKHICIANDADDFKNSVPLSFDDALRYFVVCCCIKLSLGDSRDFSMLVNPSSLTIIHSNIVTKILNKIALIKDCMSVDNPSYNDEIDLIKEQFNKYISVNPDSNASFNACIKFLPYVIRCLDAYEINATFEGKRDRERIETEKDKHYKIYVGGSMLGRGLTIKNLAITYIYNDSKKIAVDTLYQRARWLGYKQNYFDICKVYLTSNLQQKFIDIVNSEIDMWNSIDAFLETKMNLKAWPRVFSLDNDSLILTRSTVSHTVTIERMNPGYSYDKSIWLSKESRISNRHAADKYKELHKEDGFEVDFSNNKSQVAFVIDTKITEVYENFLQFYREPRNYHIGHNLLTKLYKQAKEGVIPDEISVLYIRYKTGEFREGIINDKSISELPQGRNDGTAFPGDRTLNEYAKIMHLQIHYVYTHEGETLDDAFPMLAFNNPISSRMIRFVTGDNTYGEL